MTCLPNGKIRESSLTYSMSRKWINITALVGIIASALSVTSDLLLMYNPDGNFFDPTYSYLKDIPAERMMIGHFMGIFFIPLELIGLLIVYAGLKPAGKKVATSMLVIGAYLGFPGVAYHGTVSFIAYILRNPMADQEAAFQWFKMLSDPLAGVFVTGFFVVSLIFAIPTLKGKTLFPKWVAIFNPLMIYLVLVILYFVFPALGNFLIPTGFNLAIGIQILIAWRTGRWNELG